MEIIITNHDELRRFLLDTVGVQARDGEIDSSVAIEVPVRDGLGSAGNVELPGLG